MDGRIEAGSADLQGYNDTALGFANQGGYDSEYYYQITDQFGQNLTNIDMHEELGTFTADYPGENWLSGTPNSYHSPDGMFNDQFVADYQALVSHRLFSHKTFGKRESLSRSSCILCR
jgi:hypothetical protein